uniref:Uncharacterized protein n=1 Tax=viral metagenome TaxID=1070528 RepID=A0A6C0B944_9ZZZZ
MEKSMIVQHLVLPQDVLDHICSFVFYTEIDVMIRNVTNYNIVLGEYKRVRKESLLSWGPTIISNYTVYFILPRGNQLILANLCSTCGNYTKPLYRSNHILCQCVV